ncbi:protein kinase [Plantactinospora siamensis]|uniref:non-specific serine/threonine protein kinase n=1 Tax=Plantactinospora siamensis TaxID=555372 RepID=A0ABV6P0H1_9ACTN
MKALRAGDLLARRYRLIDPVGAGGMSVIWRAHDEVLDRLVAVKVLAAALAADARFRAMVRAEARSAAQLVHPHVTAVHDYGETVAADGSVVAFVVLELLSGESLEARLTAGPLPWPEAVRVCAEVAEALAAAHRLGIVHRDVTPGNVMLTAVGAKMLDFGIATRVDAPDDDDTGETFGTPAYVAPERLDGRPARPTGDMYSFGVLLYETLTGRVPHPADTWDELAAALDRPAPPLSVPGLPPAVADACRICLSRDPYARLAAQQVAGVLRSHLPAGYPVPDTAPAVMAAAGGASTPGAADGSGPVAGSGARSGAADGSGPVPGSGARSGAAGLGGRTDLAGALGAGRADPAAGQAAVPVASDPPAGGDTSGAPAARAGGAPNGRRRLAMAAGAAVAVLTALGLALLAPRLDPDPPVAGPGGPSSAGAGTASPGPAPDPAATGGTGGPAATGGTGEPAATGGPASTDPTGAVPPAERSAPFAPAPTDAAVRGDVPAAVRAFTDLVAVGVARGGIRGDAGQDLAQVAAPLGTGTSTDVDAGVRNLRQKVADRSREGAISDRFVQQLDSGLDGIAAAGRAAGAG